MKVRHAGQHVCCYCSNTYSSSHALKVHVMIHTGEKPHACTQCDKKFGQAVQLKQHMMNHHGGEKPYQCSYCSKGFCTPSDLHVHETTHTGQKLFSCRHCGKGFRYSSGLKSHMKKLHADAATDTPPSPPAPTTPVLVKAQTLHKCSHCLETFSDQTALRTHMLSHSVGKKHICSFCNKGFSLSSQLKIHIMTHTGEKPQQCSLCDKRFVQISNLKAHMQTYHGAEKPHKCSYCPRSFRAPSYLRNHEVTHGGKRLHKCAHCSKSFDRYATLKKHMKTHVNKKTHSCCECNKAFLRLSQLKVHISRYHTKKQEPDRVSSPSSAAAASTSPVGAEEKPHSCRHCGKRFGKLASLQRHLMIHTGEKPFTCSYCFKAFRTAYNMKIHIMSHTGEKPHKCSQCDKAFIHGMSLKSHMLAIHGENNPFKCSHCPTECSTLAEFRIHETTHRKETPWTCWSDSKQPSSPAPPRQHMDSRTEVKQQGEAPVAPSTQVKVHRAKKRHECLYCPKVFRKYAALELHLTSHTGEVIYVCSHCNKSFPNMSALQQHTDQHHSNKPSTEENTLTASTGRSTTPEVPTRNTQEKSYTCPHCGKGFRYQTDLKRHKLTHATDRPHVCHYCPKAFKTSTHLKFHTMIHTGERPQKCSHCDKSFVQTSSLRWHLRTKHGTETNSHDTSTCEVATADQFAALKQEDSSSQDEGKCSLDDDHVTQTPNKSPQKQHQSSPSTSKVPKKLSKRLMSAETREGPFISSDDIKCEPSPCSDKTVTPFISSVDSKCEISPCSEKTVKSYISSEDIKCEPSPTAELSCQSSKPCDTSNELFLDTKKNMQTVRTSPRRKASSKLDDIIQKLAKKSKHGKPLTKSSPTHKKIVSAVTNSSKYRMLSTQTSPYPKKIAQGLFRSSTCETSDDPSPSLCNISEKPCSKSKHCETSNQGSAEQPSLSQYKDSPKVEKHDETTSKYQASKNPNNITMPHSTSQNRIARKRKVPLRFRDGISFHRNSANSDEITKVVIKAISRDSSKAIPDQLSQSPKTNVRDAPSSSQQGVPISEEAPTSLNNVTESSDGYVTPSDEASPKSKRGTRKRKLPIRFRQESASDQIPLYRTKSSQEDSITSNISKATCEHESPKSENSIQKDTKSSNAVKSELAPTPCRRVPRMRKLPARYRGDTPAGQAASRRIPKKEPMSPDGSVPLGEPCEKSVKLAGSCPKSSRRPGVTCPVCSKGLSSSTMLMYHMRRHTGDMPHACSFCGARFARWCTLVIHRRIHTGETPYKCAVCKQGFRQLPSLQVHMERHPRSKQQYSDTRKHTPTSRPITANARIAQDKRRQHRAVHARNQRKKSTRNLMT